MRVCWIIDSLGPGGAEALVPRFAAAAVGSDVELQVVVLRRPEVAPHAASVRDTGVPVVSVDARNLRDVSAFRRFLRGLRDSRPDVLHAHLRYATIWAAVASLLTGIPLVATLHELPGGARGVREGLRELLMLRLLRWRAASVIAVSDAAARACASRLPESRVRVVRNGAPAVSSRPDVETVARRRTELGVPADAALMIAVAVLRPDKGLDVTLRALRRVIEEIPDARLLVVGAGPAEDALRHLARRCRVAGRCIFLGHREDVQDLYPVADLLVHASRREALPTVVLEAMAAGLPVVATDVGGTPELVAHGTNGLLVPPDDSDALAEGALALLRDPPRARAMGREGQRRVATTLDTATWFDRLRAVYADAVAGDSTPAGVESARGAP